MKVYCMGVSMDEVTQWVKFRLVDTPPGQKPDFTIGFTNKSLWNKYTPGVTYTFTITPDANSK